MFASYEVATSFPSLTAIKGYDLDKSADVPLMGHLNLTSEGLKYPQEVWVQHETCSTICGTPVQAILDQKNLTGLAGGVREGPNIAKYGPRFWLLSPLEAIR